MYKTGNHIPFCPSYTGVIFWKKQKKTEGKGEKDKGYLLKAFSFAIGDAKVSICAGIWM